MPFVNIDVNVNDLKTLKLYAEALLDQINDSAKITSQARGVLLHSASPLPSVRIAAGRVSQSCTNLDDQTAKVRTDLTILISGLESAIADYPSAEINLASKGSPYASFPYAFPF